MSIETNFEDYRLQTYWLTNIDVCGTYNSTIAKLQYINRTL